MRRNEGKAARGHSNLQRLDPLARFALARFRTVDPRVAWEIALALPATIAGAWLGAFIYRPFADRGYQRVLTASMPAFGLILIWTSW